MIFAPDSLCHLIGAHHAPVQSFGPPTASRHTLSRPLWWAPSTLFPFLPLHPAKSANHMTIVRRVPRVLHTCSPSLFVCHVLQGLIQLLLRPDQRWNYGDVKTLKSLVQRGVVIRLVFRLWAAAHTKYTGRNRPLILWSHYFSPWRCLRTEFVTVFSETVFLLFFCCASSLVEFLKLQCFIGL